MPGLFNIDDEEEKKKNNSSGGLFNSNDIPEPSRPSNGGLFQLESGNQAQIKQPQSGGGLFNAGQSFADDTDTVNPYDTTKLDRSIGNAQMRIEDAGGQVNNDNRNWFEKATNLPKDQNWLFDALDIINRPQQAFYGAVDAVYDKNYGDIGKQALEGVKGNDKRLFKDFIDPFGKFTEENLGVNVSDKLGLTEPGWKRSTLGFTGDVVADPINFVPAGAISKVTKLGANALGVPLKAGRDLAESAVPSLKTFREGTVEPTIDAVKDGLGNVFKYQNKWDETLNGTKDDTLKNLYNNTENDIKFRQEEAFRNVADSAKAAGGIKTGDDVGRLMEKDLEVYGPRPARQYSTDPKIQQAADNLVKGNNEIRDWANNSGIDIPELEGYMTHVLTAAERAARKKNKPLIVDRGNSGLGQPSKSILNARTLQGSAEDINQQMGRDFFNPNAYFSTAIGQKRLIEYVGARKFKDEVLTNPDFATKYQKGMQIPDSAVVINPDNYKFFKVQNDDGRDFLAMAKGQEYVVTKGAKAALDRFDKLTTDEGTRGLLRAIDTIQSGWKKLTLFSPGYHIRNIGGGIYNNFIGGMNPLAITKYGAQANADLIKALQGKETNLFKEYRQQGLSSSNLSKLEFKGGADPEKGIERAIKDRSKGLGGQILQRINPLNAFKTSRELGDFFDQTHRFSLYKWARDKGMTAEQAAAKVRETQFDYSRTTNAETEFLARAIPFYRWMRNNVPFQLKKLIENPARSSVLNKARINAQDSFLNTDDEHTPQFMKEQMAVPVSENKFLSLNLPQSDLTKLSDPMKLLSDSTTPLLKLPLELASNYNTFKRKKIEEFNGQEKKYQVGDKEFGIPIKNAYVLEQLGGQIGRGLSGYLQKPESENQDDKFRIPSMGISSVLKDYDPAAENYYRMLKQLKDLQDQISYIEQQTGARPKSVSDIKHGR